MKSSDPSGIRFMERVTMDPSVLKPGSPQQMEFLAEFRQACTQRGFLPRNFEEFRTRAQSHWARFFQHVPEQRRRIPDVLALLEAIHKNPKVPVSKHIRANTNDTLAAQPLGRKEPLAGSTADRVPSKIITVDQVGITPVTGFETDDGAFSIQFAYQPWGEFLDSGAPGQDAICMGQKGTLTAICVSDGVSESFMGHIAAEVAGKAIVEELLSNPQSLTQKSKVSKHVQTALTNAQTTGAKQVANFRLDDNLPELVREVQEDKRREGSCAVFSAAFFDSSNRKFALVWLGDCRFELKAEKGKNITPTINSNWKKAGDWSTEHGVKGKMKVFLGDLDKMKIETIALHSDGMLGERGLPDLAGDPAVINEHMNSLYDLATNDDAAFVAVTVKEKK